VWEGVSELQGNKRLSRNFVCYLDMVFDNLKSNVLNSLLNSEIQFRLIICYLMLHAREYEGDRLHFSLDSTGCML